MPQLARQARQALGRELGKQTTCMISVQVLTQVEKEAQSLKKKLSHEQKAKLQKTHTQIQQARSLRQMELAKSTNIDKLVSLVDSTSFYRGLP